MRKGGIYLSTYYDEVFKNFSEDVHNGILEVTNINETVFDIFITVFMIILSIVTVVSLTMMLVIIVYRYKRRRKVKRKNKEEKKNNGRNEIA